MINNYNKVNKKVVAQHKINKIKIFKIKINNNKIFMVIKKVEM